MNLALQHEFSALQFSLSSLRAAATIESEPTWRAHGSRHPQRQPGRRPPPHRHRHRRRPHRRGRARACPCAARARSTPAATLVSPPFVDAHFHMDATLSYGLPRVNQSGTLLEGIALWGELKPQLAQEALIERAHAVLRLGGGARPAGDPHPRRHLRRPPAGGRGAAGSASAAWRPTSTCSWWPFRRTACCAAPPPSTT